ncbi:hypothetical protein ACP70R_032657 [Stipagrostis hirtigluma subsp. patula]
MYLVEDVGGAIGLMAVALVLLGTWPVVLAVLERRGRLPQHTFLDFSIANFLGAVLIALTFGQIGADTPETPNFLTQLTQDNWPSVMFAMAGGVAVSLGQLATQYGWAFVGVSVTEVMASSLKVALEPEDDVTETFPPGGTLNYFLDGRINKAEILFPGIGCFLIAAILGCFVHSSNAQDNQEKLASSMVNHGNNTRTSFCVMAEYIFKNGAYEELTKNLIEKERPKDVEEGKLDASLANQTPAKVEAGTAEFLVDLEEKRSIKMCWEPTRWWASASSSSRASATRSSAWRSTWPPTTSGTPSPPACRAWWSTRPTSTSPSPASPPAWRSTSGSSTAPWPACRGRRCPVAAYDRDGEGRGLALLAGALCGVGGAFMFMAGQAAGYAAADSVQALPLVSTFWGVVLFGEYRRSSRRTYALLGSMLVMFVVAMAVLMASSAHRD